MFSVKPVCKKIVSCAIWFVIVKFSELRTRTIDLDHHASVPLKHKFRSGFPAPPFFLFEAEPGGSFPQPLQLKIPHCFGEVEGNHEIPVISPLFFLFLDFHFLRPVVSA